MAASNSMYRLVKLQGVNPEKVTVIRRSGDQAKLEAQRDELLKSAFLVGGPAVLRYGVRVAGTGPS